MTVETALARDVITETDAPASARRVLILVENLPVPFDRRVWQEALALRGAGYEVTVICPMGRGHDVAEEVIQGVRVYRHPLPEAGGAVGYLREYGLALWRQSRLALKVWRRHGFDVVHACNPPDLLWMVALPYRLLFGVRFIFDHHDLAPELFEVKFGRRGPVHWMLRLMERITFRMADASIATNETFRDIAVTRGRMNPAQVRVVKSYPNLCRFKRVTPEPGLCAPDELLIGYVGVIGEQDGLEYLVRAMAELTRKRGRRDLRCLVIGDGPALARCRAEADALGVADRIRFTGFLTGAPLLAHLSALDIGVIPDPTNAFNDKLSMNKVFEYTALGLPFVQFDLAQARLEAADMAEIAEPCSAEALADAIIRLADDPERCAAMAEYGMARAARNFAWESQIPELLEAYDVAFATQCVVSKAR